MFYFFLSYWSAGKVYFILLASTLAEKASLFSGPNDATMLILFHRDHCPHLLFFPWKQSEVIFCLLSFKESGHPWGWGVNIWVLTLETAKKQEVWPPAESAISAWTLICFWGILLWLRKMGGRRQMNRVLGGRTSFCSYYKLVNYSIPVTSLVLSRPDLRLEESLPAPAGNCPIQKCKWWKLPVVWRGQMTSGSNSRWLADCWLAMCKLCNASLSRRKDLHTSSKQTWTATGSGIHSIAQLKEKAEVSVLVASQGSCGAIPLVGKKQVAAT